MLLALRVVGVTLMVSEQRSCDYRPRSESCISSSRLGILCDYVTYASFVQVCLIVWIFVTYVWLEYVH